MWTGKPNFCCRDRKAAFLRPRMSWGRWRMTRRLSFRVPSRTGNGCGSGLQCRPLTMTGCWPRVPYQMNGFTLTCLFVTFLFGWRGIYARYAVCRKAVFRQTFVCCRVWRLKLFSAGFTLLRRDKVSPADFWASVVCRPVWRLVGRRVVPFVLYF